MVGCKNICDANALKPWRPRPGTNTGKVFIYIRANMLRMVDPISY
jgi:hypothetical protein